MAEETGADFVSERVAPLFVSDNCTVTWGDRPTFPTGAELEIGDGSGHGFSLSWLLFRPGDDGVQVLSIRYKQERKQYRSTWPPDLAPVTVYSARMGMEAYSILQRDLSQVAASQPQLREGVGFTKSTNNFWVFARLALGALSCMELHWAGYWSTREEWQFITPRAAVTLAREAVAGLDFTDHPLTSVERAWASAKFIRDWAILQRMKFTWWVRERYLIMIGVVGDASVLPLLREVINEPPENPSDRNRYFAINAVTRLLGKDVRDKPVEEMDVEKTRTKVLELFQDVK